MDMDPQELLLPGVVVATSVAALLIVRRMLRLRPSVLGRALARTLETLGLLMLFAVLNMALGVTFVLAWRGISGEFLSFYLLNDAVLGILSLVEALIFQWWWVGGD
jgi:multisubunit Na+/H+ antiporter MnhB subunit